MSYQQTTFTTPVAAQHTGCFGTTHVFVAGARSCLCGACAATPPSTTPPTVLTSGA